MDDFDESETAHSERKSATKATAHLPLIWAIWKWTWGIAGAALSAIALGYFTGLFKPILDRVIVPVWPIKYTIRGKIANQGKAIHGVTVVLDGSPESSPDSAGSYCFYEVSPGAHVLSFHTPDGWSAAHVNYGMGIPSSDPEIPPHDLSMLVYSGERESQEFLLAVEHGDVILIKQLLRRGYSPDCRNPKNGQTALYVAVTKQHTEVVRLLLAHHARVNPVTTDCRTPLMEAARSGNYAIVQALLDKGANCAWIDGTGRTPLMEALISRQVDPVKHLAIKAPEVINARDRTGETALAAAERIPNYSDVVNLFISLGAKRHIAGHPGSD